MKKIKKTFSFDDFFSILITMNASFFNLLLLLILFFQTVEAGSPPSKEWADRLFSATCFEKSIEVYESLLRENTCSEEEISLVNYRIAQAYYILKQYQNSVNHLEKWLKIEKLNLSTSLLEKREIHIQSLNLAGKCYRILNEFEKSIEMFDLALQLLNNSQNGEKIELLFEKGLTYYVSKEFDLSYQLFSEILRTTLDLDIKTLAGLFLSRTLIAQGKSEDAENILLALDLSSPINFEVNFILGELNFLKRNYPHAAHYFEKALPEKKPEKAIWSKETLLYLGASYFALALESGSDTQMISQLLDSSEYAYKNSLLFSFDEQSFLGLMQCFHFRKKKLNDHSAFECAKKAFENYSFRLTNTKKAEISLILAETAPTHIERDLLYTEFIRNTDRRDPYYPIGWYQKGLNNFNEAESLNSDRNKNQQYLLTLLENASSEFQNAFDLLRDRDKNLAALSIQYASKAAYLQDTPLKKEKAFKILNELITEYSDIFKQLEDQDEIYYQLAVIGCNLYFEEDGGEYFEKTVDKLQHLIDEYPKKGKVPEAYLLLGKLFFMSQNYQEAETNLSLLIELFPTSPIIPESLFWLARTKMKLNVDRSIVNQIFQKIYTNYQASPFAPEAYFSIYTFKDYLQGNRNTSKHLQSFVKQFPETPLTIAAYYLLGLDYKKDRKSSSGRWIRKKNMIASIDSFQTAVDLFDRLYEKNILNQEDLTYYTSLRYRSALEKGLMNLIVANESQGTKQLLYLEYAEKIFRHLYEEFERSKEIPLKILVKCTAYSQLREETSYSLSDTYIKMSKYNEAEKILLKMIDHYQSEKITRGYYLSRAWYQLGFIAMKNEDYNLALEYFSHAEDTSKGNILSADERLDLQIQESLCHKFLDHLDLAMLILSNVINDQAISSLRVKAMYLRAELYEQQGREELARKQLEATAKKGGPWALKAKTKLEETYGYL